MARQAVAYAMDREEDAFHGLPRHQRHRAGSLRRASWATLDAGLPTYDPAKAKELVAQYESETGQPFEFTAVILNTPLRRRWRSSCRTS
ncbi:MAG: hypothetical protein R2789_02085 [Microthrixaceae bacterium]